MKVNASKGNKEIIFSGLRHLTTDSVSLGGTPIERVELAKLLGVTISADLSWNSHIQNTIAKCNSSFRF